MRVKLWLRNSGGKRQFKRSPKPLKVHSLQTHQSMRDCGPLFKPNNRNYWM
jgi:hypothetical protein